MKKATFLLALTLVASAANAAQLVEAIVVRVGDRILTRTQYAKRLSEGYNEIDQTAAPAEVAAKKAALKKDLLNDIIAELLIKDRADRIGLAVTESDMKDAIGRLKQQYGITTDEAFEDSLKKSGMTRPEMESRLRDTLIANKVFARELRSREDLTDRELRERYDREKEHYRLPERAHLRAIIIAKPDNAAQAAQAQTRATELGQQARTASDFAAFAKSVPENAMKDNGGDMGDVARGELLPDLDKAVFNANPGAIIGPIATRSGWHIIKVENRLPSEVPAFESVKDKLRKDASDETFQRDYRAYIERLRKEAFVQINEQNVPST